MSWPPKGPGSSSSDLTAGNANGITYFGPAFRANTSSGKYVLEQFTQGAWEPIQTSNTRGTNLASSVTTGVGSFHLGGIHSIGSAGENVVFKNRETGVCWSPVWQGQSKDGSIVYPPTVRLLSQTQSILEPNGAMRNGTQGSYSVHIEPTVNVSFTRVEFYIAEAYTGRIRWVAQTSATETMLCDVYVGTESTTYVAGDLVRVDFDYPLDIRAGGAIDIDAYKADGVNAGAYIKARLGTTNTTWPYRKTWSRTFTDSEILTNQGTQPPAGLELTGYLEGANYTISQGITVNSAGVKYEFPDKVLTSWALPAASTAVATGINLGNTKGFVPATATNLSIGTAPLISLIAKDLVYCNGSITASGASKVLDLPKLEVITGGLTLGTPTGVYDTLDLSSLRFLGAALAITGPLNLIPTLPLVPAGYGASTSVLWTGTTCSFANTKYGATSIAGANLLTAAFPNCTTFTGAFGLNSATATSLSLPVLASVTGSMGITGNSITTLTTPLLNSVTGGVNVTANALPTLALPALVNVGSLTIAGNALTAISAPLLANSGSSLSVTSTSLTNLSLPQLTSAGNVTLSTPALSTLSLPLLATSTGAWAVAGAISTISLPALTTLPSIAFTGNSLTSFSAPLVTTTGVLSFTGTSALTLSMPALATITQQPVFSTPLGAFNLPALTTVATALYFSQVVGNVNLPLLTSVPQINFQAGVGNFTANALTTVGAVSFTGGGGAISFPSLVSTTGSMWLTGTFTSLSLPAATSLVSLNIVGSVGTITTVPSLVIGSVGYGGPATTFSLPNVAAITQGMAWSSAPNLTSVSFPGLTGAFGGFSGTQPMTIQSINLGNATSIGAVNSSTSISLGYAAFNSFTIPASVKSIAGDIMIGSSTLPATMVDAIFIKLAALDGTNGTTMFVKNVRVGSATPATAASAAARATLVARGCSVSTT